MSSSYKSALAATALLAALTSSASAATSGSGTTTRYWDCCKPSCAWPSSSLTAPVKVCDASDNPITNDNGNTASGCTGGSAYMCSSQSPWAVSDSLAYGFAAVSASANPPCCSCYKLTFTSTAIAGKTMIVQATNTGGDVGATQFDLAMPGGGFGIFDACTTEWKATTAVWGAQYGGPSTNTCSEFPTALQPGCDFRWDWMEGADNPTVDFETVACPAEIVAKSGCSVVGSTPVAGSSSVASSPSAGASSSAAVVAPEKDKSTSSSAAAAVAPASSSVADQVAGSSVSAATAAAGASTAAAEGPGQATTAAASPTGVAGAAGAKGRHGVKHHAFRKSSTLVVMPKATAAAPEEEEQDDCEL